MGEGKRQTGLVAQTRGGTLALLEKLTALQSKTVNFPWAISIDREDAAALASLRLTRGIEVGEDGPVIWLRGKQEDEQLASGLLRVPSRQRYEWLAQNQLRQVDQRIPM